MAGRIPQQFIDQLLDRVDIVEVIDSRVSLRKSGRNFMACCPFHDEKSPSFSVQPEKQFYYCFGCGAGGNALGFLMDYERLDFRAAIDVLASKCGMQVPQESVQDSQQTQRKQDLYSVLEHADRYYRQQLREHSAANEAISYLKERGLSGKIAARFGVGFAPAGWDNLLKNGGKDKDAQALLLEAGMLVSKDESEPSARLYDRFRHRIMFPIRDSRGRTIAFGGRVLGDDKPKYLNSPETPVFHKGRELYGLYEARQANKHLPLLMIVEGYMDVIALAQQGIECAVATLGTSTSTTHLQRLFRHSQELVFCFDGDKAGLSAAERALGSTLPAMEDGRQVKFLFLPDGEDPDTLVRSEGAECFRQRIDSAMPLSEYIFQLSAEGLDTSTADGKAALSQRAVSYIDQLPSGAFRQIMLAELAGRTGLNVSAVESLATVNISESETAVLMAEREVAEQELLVRKPARAAAPAESMNLAQSAISLLLYKPQLAELAGDLSVLESMGEEDIHLLLEILRLLERRPDSTTGMLLGYWYGQPEGEKLTALCGRGIELLREGMDVLDQQSSDAMAFEVGLEQQFVDIVSKLKGLISKRRLAELLALAKDAGSQGQQLPMELQEELKSLLKD